MTLTSLSPPAPSLNPECSTPVVVPCLYCGGDDYQPLLSAIQDRLRHVLGLWAFVRCRSCGSAMLSPTPQAADLESFYPPVYTFSPELAKAGTIQRFLANLEYWLFFRTIYEAHVRLVTRLTRRPKGAPGKLLDIGCGRGLRLKHFQRHGYDVRGMDFTPDSVDYVRDSLGIPAVSTDIGGLQSEFEPESFDVITAFSVIEHLLDVRAALAASYELLRPGGWIVVQVPLADSLQAAMFGCRWLGYTEAPRHISLPSRSGLRQLLIEVGFDAAPVREVPDTALANAALVGLSLFPGGAATRSYGSSRALGLLTRLCGAAAVPLAWPWTLVENYLIRRPAQGLMFARKPLD